MKTAQAQPLCYSPDWQAARTGAASRLIPTAVLRSCSPLTSVHWGGWKRPEKTFRISSLPRPSFAVTIEGQTLPCQEPPWSHLTAVDTTTGDIAWRILCVSDSLPPGKQNTGWPGRAAALITASDLLFIASTDDNRFRGLRASTGEILWSGS